MNYRLAAIALALVLPGFTPVPATAQNTDSPVTLYVLDSGSIFEWGCFDLCECAIRQSSLKGTFELERLDPDPLFEHYEVRSVNWVVQEPVGDLQITGSGSYQAGGEFAVQHRMSLDLAVGDRPTQRFDSGVIVGGGEFPKILIQIRLHQSPACADTVISVRGSPLVLGVEDGGTGLPRVSPNPFRDRAYVSFALREAGRVDVGVYDLAGRAVRKLASGAWLEAGLHALDWNGRRDDGTEPAAGMYFVRVRADGREDMTGLVKLR